MALDTTIVLLSLQRIGQSICCRNVLFYIHSREKIEVVQSLNFSNDTPVFKKSASFNFLKNSASVFLFLFGKLDIIFIETNYEQHRCAF